MKVTVLVENTASSELYGCEHGLSFWLEICGKTIMYDFGQSELWYENAKKLNLDLSKVDLGILSHGHYDHGGGLKCFLEKNPSAIVYCNENVFGEYYNADARYIGLEQSLRNHPRLAMVKDKLNISENLTLFSCNDLPAYREAPGAGLTKGIRENGGGEWKRMPDDFAHEQYLLAEESGKRILISACSHKGILNLCKWFQPDVCIGGFHFMKMETTGEDARKLREIAEALLAFPTVYYTCHCTGDAQYGILKEVMGERLHRLSAGMRVEV